MMADVELVDNTGHSVHIHLAGNRISRDVGCGSSDLAV